MGEWADLPVGILDLILSKLYAEDRHNIRHVCRSWNAAAVSSPYQNSPCLMFRRNNQEWGFFQYKSFFCMSFQRLQNAYICCSNYGWLLMCRDDNSLFFFDPFIRRKIEVYSIINSRYTSVYFFYPPTSPDCFIVGIKKDVCSHDVKIGILRYGEWETHWETHTYKNKDEFLVSMCGPVLHDGLLYFVDIKGNVATLDIGKHGFQSSWVVYTKCLKFSRLRSKIKHSFLFKIKGEEEALYAVFLIHEDQKVNVFRLLKPEMKWESVRDLGDKMLYLSHTSSFGDTAQPKSMANTICFPTCYGDSVLLYSLDTQKYHSFEGDYSNKGAIKLSRMNSHVTAWITPEFSTECLEVDDPEIYDSKEYNPEECDPEEDDSEEYDSDEYDSEEYDSEEDDSKEDDLEVDDSKWVM